MADCRPLRFGGSHSLRFSLSSLLLTFGGAWLTALGGSDYYVVAGLVGLSSAVQLRRGSNRGVRLYALLLLGSLLWALWEVGLDRWGLMPRLLGPAILGFWLLLPGGQTGSSRRPDPILAFAVAAVLLAVFASWIGPGSDRAPTTGRALTPEDFAGETADDWPAIAGTAGAAHYSALDQISPGNVTDLKVAWTFQLPGTSPVRTSGSLTGTPIKIDDTLYLCSEKNEIFARSRDRKAALEIRSPRQS